MNIIRTGRIARRSKTGFTGKSFGTANQEASATLSQFNTHAFVYSTPSAVTPVFGKTKPMIIAAMYPKIMPNKIDDELKKPFVACLKNKITISTNNASNRFSMEPKSSALFPPPKELIPTEIRLNPIDITTVPVTTDGKNLRRGFKKKPSTVSKRPPIIDAPMIAPYASIPPPMVAATLLKTPINPEDVPIMIGTRPPTGPIPNNCTNVTIPAISIAF